MKTRKMLFIALAGFIGLTALTSCGGGGGSEQQTSADESTKMEDASGPDDAQLARGEKIYNEKCFACHQKDGNGIPNAFPTLVGSDFLLNHTKEAVAQVLNGSEHVPSHGNITYPAPMPPQVDNYEDAVAVINYVLNNFGNDGGYITVDEVKDIKIIR
ncbi:MAG: cytochrome c [Lentimicrobiaceae bacterium]|jgi:nitrite reductase (NO-forming)|nr:cytochrome c [Lentimicrobiaceae bacterium]MDD4597001.1 cytochrome c [Lentimicrobiaceae bacterium]MDY0027145.1 cytochrome c [Lentimicrobium sp.]